MPAALGYSLIGLAVTIAAIVILVALKVVDRRIDQASSGLIRPGDGKG
jgi:hypothetical protein